MNQISIKVGVVSENASGEPDIAFRVVNCTQSEYDDGAHYELAEIMVQMDGYTPMFSFDQNDPAWQALGEAGILVSLPDPVTKGWLAAISDAYHLAKDSDREESAREHLKGKIHEIHSFLNIVDKAQRFKRDLRFQRTASDADCAQAICDIAGVVIKQNDAGEWIWSTKAQTAVAGGIDQEDAASNAVNTLFPKTDWKFEVTNDDTKLGYFEWALHRAEAEQEGQVDSNVSRPVERE